MGSDQEYETDLSSVETHKSEQYYFIIAIDDVIGVNEFSPSVLTKHESLHIQILINQLLSFDGEYLELCTFLCAKVNTNISNIDNFRFLF